MRSSGSIYVLMPLIVVVLPTYFRIMGVFFCLIALRLLWIATTGDFSN
jgi:hypothetical protein